MKRKIIVLSTLTLAFLVCGCTSGKSKSTASQTSKAETASISEQDSEDTKENETQETSTAKQNENIADIQKSYGEKVKMYVDAFNSAQSGNADSVSDEVNTEFLAVINNGEFNPTFILHDLNNDGTPELFIGLVPKGSTDITDNTIFDVFTYTNESVRLMEDIGYRAGTCIICNDGIIKDEWSSNAFEGGANYLELAANGLALSTKDSISIHGSNDDKEPQYYHSEDIDKDKKISEDDYNQIADSYQQNTNIKVNIADESNLSLLLQGNFK